MYVGTAAGTSSAPPPRTAPTSSRCRPTCTAFRSR
jgi:hypothetical protein